MMKALIRIGGAAVLTTGLLLAAGCSSAESAETRGDQRNNFGDCDITENPTIYELDPMTDGALTVAASLPYPAGYRGNTLEDVNGGYMYCMVAEIANRAGLDRVELVNAPFEALVTAKASNFDMAVWDIIVTPEREKAVDFSTPYNTYQTGVLVRADSDLTQESIKDSVVGVLAGSRQQTLVEEQIKPKEVRVFNSNDDLFNALLAKQLDVALNDTATVMPRAAESGGKLEVIAQYEVGGDVAVLFPKGSANLEPTNQILKDMRADGTLDKIMDRWLNEILGGDPNALEVWTA